MKHTAALTSARAVLLVGWAVIAGPRPSFAQAPLASVLGQVESIDAASKALKLKAEDGSIVAITLADKGTVVKVAPGEKSLQNAGPIGFDAIKVGDRVLVRGGQKTEGRLEGALRIVVMAKAELTARDEQDARAWRERGIAGTVTGVDPAKGEFTIRISGAAPSAGSQNPTAAPTAAPAITVDASKATLHRYADTSVKFDDAKPAAVADLAIGDQARLLGKRSEDGSRVTADRVVFGSFKTAALAIEKVDAATGLLSVKDLETNKKFTISVVAGGAIKKIPAEMGAMFAMMGSGGSGRPGMGGPRGETTGAAGGSMGGRPGGDHPGGMAGRPGGDHPGGMGAGQNSGGGERPAGRGNRGMEDMVDRLPSITFAELKKDDWIGAVIGKVDASGKAIAFNVLAGIEVFASRANRGGGVDVGMPAGLLDGAFGVP